MYFRLSSNYNLGYNKISLGLQSLDQLLLQKNIPSNKA